MNLENRLGWAVLLLRCSVGVLFLAHGLYLKLFVFGMALILGVFTRWVSIGLVPVLAGAVGVHAGNGWLFSASNGGWEYPVFWLVVMLALALLGDGRYSLARAIRPRPRDSALSA